MSTITTELVSRSDTTAEGSRVERVETRVEHLLERVEIGRVEAASGASVST